MRMKNLILVLFIPILLTNCFCNKINDFKISPSTRPSYSKNDELLLFAPVIKKKYRIITYNTKSKNVRIINPLLLKSDNYYDPVFSPDEKRIAFVWYNKKLKASEICLIDINGTGFEQITRANHYSFKPFFSPDGEKIYFLRTIKKKKERIGFLLSIIDYLFPILKVRGSMSAGYRLHSIDIISKEEKELTKVYYYIYNPTITSDGKYIVFSLFYEDKIYGFNYKIVKLDLFSKNVITLLDKKRTLTPAINPINGKIVYLGSDISGKEFKDGSKSGNKGMYILDSNNKSIFLKQLYSGVYYLSISPSGKKAIYMGRIIHDHKTIEYKIMEFDFKTNNAKEIVVDKEKILSAFKK